MTKERIIIAILASIVAYLAGAVLAYFIAVRPMLEFLFGFSNPIMTIETPYGLTLTSFMMSIVLALPFAAFFTPIILAWQRVVSPQRLGGLWRLWIVLALVLAAVTTPTIDPINQIIIALVLFLSLEAGIQLSKLISKNRHKALQVAVD